MDDTEFEIVVELRASQDRWLKTQKNWKERWIEVYRVLAPDSETASQQFGTVLYAPFRTEYVESVSEPVLVLSQSRMIRAGETCRLIGRNIMRV